MATQSYDMKNILVLGGAGFIGSHLCDALVNDNRVICVDNFISGVQGNIDHLLRHDNFIFINANVSEMKPIEEYQELERFDVKFQGVQEIYNLACPTSPKDFNKYRIATAKANSVGVAKSLDIAVKYKAKYLFFSSSVVYGGRDETDPYMPEDRYRAMDPLSPRACYDEGKRFAESLVNCYRDVYSLDTKILRIFTTYGPRMQLFQGHMIPDFIVAALDNKPLQIYGDSEFTTTLCYVSDVVEAALKIMSSTHAGPFNVGNPTEYRISEIAQKIAVMTNSSSQIEYHDRLLFMSKLGIPNISKAKEALDWMPIITLDDGLEKTIEYTQANKILVDWTTVVPVKDDPFMTTEEGGIK